jgi:hypothetical protein
VVSLEALKQQVHNLQSKCITFNHILNPANNKHNHQL